MLSQGEGIGVSEMAEISIDGCQHLLYQLKWRIVSDEGQKERVVLKKLALEVLHNPPPHQNAVRLDNVTEPINASVGRLQDLFFGVELQLKVLFQKRNDFAPPCFQLLPVAGKEQKIVNIAKIVGGLERVLGELVKFVQVYISKELRSKIANGQALLFRHMKERFMGRDFFKQRWIAFADKVLDWVAENEEMREP